ncbi:TPA: IS5/IS1182 family transposase, partial [Vibrio cholerae]
YDTKNCHETLKKKGCTPLIPPRKNAALWEDGHPRNEAVTALKNGAIAEWKAESGYHYRSISETAISRYKGLTSGKLSLRCYNAQVGEIMANVKAINKVIGLGMPVRS